MRPLLVTAALLLALPAGAQATVPPVDCGTIEVKGQRHHVKADGITCRKAKRFTRRYVRRHTEPAGWTCKRYPKTSLFRFRCWKGTTKSFHSQRK